MTSERRIAERAYNFTNAHNRVSLDLHRKLGFRELPRSFTGPGVPFDGGHGVLDVIELGAATTGLSGDPPA